MTVISTDRSVRALLKQGIEQLRTSDVPSYTLAAELLLLHVTSQSRTWLYSHPEEVLSESVAENYFLLLARRGSGIPTQHLTGKQEFWGLEFEVTPDVLIPRPETEHLIEVALDRLAVREIRAGRHQQLSRENVTLVDIGTGSGCIAITLAKELSAATVYATDISERAIVVARRNAARHGLSDRIHFLQSNLLDAFASAAANSAQRFDLIISNPPYVSLREAESLPIEVRQHEPQTALFGGEEGYELYGVLIPEAAQHLKPGGLLVLELGYNSLPAVEPLLDRSEWSGVSVTKDLAGIPRVISAERLFRPH
ncbi:MAG TPA: peptide chain release factor N(5)-glutamine methyltransferase [Verrucomicrobiae bacterium]|nr:peptide chain release factor N(5)-glutamine methyltransferase [Verrucomicrobiae bacterium]